MLRFQRALVAELLIIFTLVLLVVTTIIFFGTTVQLVAKSGEGAGARLLVELVPNLLPMALSYSLPFSWLTAVALVVGRMVNDHEVTALRSAGVHLRALVAPVLALGAVLAVGGMAVSIYWAPAAQREINGSMREYMRIFLTDLKDVDRNVNLGNGRLSWARYDPDTEEFLGVELDRRGPEGRLEMKVLARRLGMRQVAQREDGDGLEFRFTDAYVIPGDAEAPEGVRREKDAFVKMGKVEKRGFDSSLVEGVAALGHVERVDTSIVFDELFGGNPYRLRPKDMTLPELSYTLARGGVFGGTLTEAQTALHGRLALGCGPFFMGLFALAVALLLPPTGRRVRDFLVAFVPSGVVFFPLFLAGPSLVGPTGLPVWSVLWGSNILLAATSSLLLLLAFRR